MNVLISVILIFLVLFAVGVVIAAWVDVGLPKNALDWVFCVATHIMVSLTAVGTGWFLIKEVWKC